MNNSLATKKNAVFCLLLKISFGKKFKFACKTIKKIEHLQ